ncbi:MAG: hypothetical protein WD398_06505 [Cyclobacteriaceae bacterium]
MSQRLPFLFFRIGQYLSLLTVQPSDIISVDIPIPLLKNRCKRKDISFQKSEINTRSVFMPSRMNTNYAINWNRVSIECLLVYGFLFLSLGFIEIGGMIYAIWVHYLNGG